MAFEKTAAEEQQSEFSWGQEKTAGNKLQAQVERILSIILVKKGGKERIGIAQRGNRIPFPKE